MAQTTPTTEPGSLIAGDTARWQISLPNHLPADGWQLVYTLVNATQRLTFGTTAAPDGSGAHLVNETPATTAAWPPGPCEWRAQAIHATLGTYTLRSGSVVVQPSFGTATDARGHAAKVLATIEAYLENSSNLAAAEYEIAGRRLKRHSLPELLTLRDRYRAEVLREQAASAAARGMPGRGRVLVRFGP